MPDTKDTRSLREFLSSDERIQRATAEAIAVDEAMKGGAIPHPVHGLPPLTEVDVGAAIEKELPIGNLAGVAKLRPITR